jgi:acyl-CoA synthetase (NDP forming)|nr:acetate--CoA ligase family protein [Candidatus Krumholzibacteria bacterium]
MGYREVDTFLNDLAPLQAVGSSKSGGQRLNEMEVYHLLDLLGLERCPAEYLDLSSGVSLSDDSVLVWAQNALRLVGPEGRLILKVVGRKILHKTEAGGVKVLTCEGDQQAEGIIQAARAMVANLEATGLGDLVEGLMAASFVPHHANRPGQEVLLSLRQDPAFGPCVVLGIGGTLTEWYGAGTGGNSTLVFPAEGLTEELVAQAIESHPLLGLLYVPSRLYPQAPMDTSLLVRGVMKLAEIGTHCGPQGTSPWTLEEIEINPAVACGGKLIALDGVGLVSTRKWAAPDRPLEKIHPLLAPRSAVVLGVSAKGANPGRIILKNLLSSEGIAKDRLYVVHHREKEISGVPCFADIASLPEKCDLAVVSVPAQGALEAIGELVRQDKAAGIILIPGGFAEAGESDLAEAIEKVLQEGHQQPGGGPVMVGGNCLGIVSRGNYNTFFLPAYKLPFNPGQGENLAVVSQSGAYLVTFASNYDGVIHPRASISFGNQMDLTVADFLAHFNDQEEVNVIACYVEGFRPGDGRRFLKEARRARQAGKKVIIFKAGKTALGAQAAASHTASLAGDYAVARSCLESAGVTVAESLDEFEDFLKTFTLLAGKSVQGNRTGIISNAGFECSTVMDRLDGLELAEFDPATQATLDEILPGFAHRTNPIDCTPMTGTDAFCESCRGILESSQVDVAILSSVPVTPALDNLPAHPEGKHPEDLTREGSQPRRMIQILQSSSKPAVVVVDSGELYDPMCRMIESAGIPVFRKIDRAARALAAFVNS